MGHSHLVVGRLSERHRAVERPRACKRPRTLPLSVDDYHRGILAIKPADSCPHLSQKSASHSRDITACPRLSLLADFGVHWPILLFRPSYRERSHKQMENPEERYTLFPSLARFRGAFRTGRPLRRWKAQSSRPGGCRTRHTHGRPSHLTSGITVVCLHWAD